MSFLHVDEDAVIRATAANLRMTTGRVAEVVGEWAEQYGRAYMVARKAARMAADAPAEDAGTPDTPPAAEDATEPVTATVEKVRAKRPRASKVKQPDGTPPPPAEVPRMTAPDDMTEAAAHPS